MENENKSYPTIYIIVHYLYNCLHKQTAAID